LDFRTNSHSPLCSCIKCVFVSRTNKNNCIKQNKNAKGNGTIIIAETESENVILLILLRNFVKLAGTFDIDGKLNSINDKESMHKYSGAI